MLQLHDVHAYYGPVRVLRAISLEVREGEIVSLLAATRPQVHHAQNHLWRRSAARGTIEFRGSGSAGCRPKRSRGDASRWSRGTPHLPAHDHPGEPGDGAYVRSTTRRWRRIWSACSPCFPPEGADQPDRGTLSGGEQQMLAIGRALMARPVLICLDEPSMGLSPLLVERVFETISESMPKE